jgi:O-antigen/teichoic acid export membrane protein
MDPLAVNKVKHYYNIIRSKRDSTNMMILFLSLSNIFGTLLTIISGLFVAKWLLPEELGAFNSYTIITSYLILAQIGIPSALGRELPFYIGKGEMAEAYQYASVAQYWQKGLGLAFLGGGSVVSLLTLADGSPQVAAGSVVGVTAWQMLYVNKYLYVLFRTNRDFNRLSRIKFINASVSFVTIVFVWLYGFYGLCLRAIVLAIVDFSFAYYWRPLQVKPTWNRDYFKSMIKLGLPMFGVANVYGLWPTIQRTLVLTLGGTKALGLFALAVMVENSMNTVGNSMNSVIYPTMTQAWGKGATVSAVIKLIFKPFILILALFVVALPLGWYLLPIFIESFIPNYMEGIEVSQWMLFVGLLGLGNVFSNIYNVTKNQTDRLKVFISGIVIWFVVVLLDYYISGFSLLIFPKAMIAGYLVMSTYNFIHIRKIWTLNVESI